MILGDFNAQLSILENRKEYMNGKMVLELGRTISPLLWAIFMEVGKKLWVYVTKTIAKFEIGQIILKGPSPHIYNPNFH